MLARARTATGRLTDIPPALLLIAAAAACWAITVRRMPGMPGMRGMQGMGGMNAMGPRTDLGGLGWFAVVWVTMMAAMMLPSLVPMAVTHARRSRQAGALTPTVGSAMFAVGYLLTWLAAGVLAYAVVRGVGSLGLSWLAWRRGGPYVAGGVILGAALYELTPAKSRCLRHCRNPRLLAGRWRPGVDGALGTGLEHGGFCVGSSWNLMAVLFAIGVMNVAWMIVMAVVVAAEKLLPSERIAIGAAVVFIAALGVAVALVPAHVPGLTVPG